MSDSSDSPISRRSSLDSIAGALTERAPPGPLGRLPRPTLLGQRAVQGAEALSDTGTLCVFVGCHGLICAIAATRVDRLVLAADVKELPAPMPGGLPLVMVDTLVCARFDLGEQLGLPPLNLSYVLLHVPIESAPSEASQPSPSEPASVLIALRTGPCLVVQTLRKQTALSPSLFQRRPKAIVAGFAAEAVRRRLRGDSVAGVVIDPTTLFDKGQLEAAQKSLSEHARSKR